MWWIYVSQTVCVCRSVRSLIPGGSGSDNSWIFTFQEVLSQLQVTLTHKDNQHSHWHTETTDTVTDTRLKFPFQWKSEKWKFEVKGPREDYYPHCSRHICLPQLSLWNIPSTPPPIIPRRNIKSPPLRCSEFRYLICPGTPSSRICSQRHGQGSFTSVLPCDVLKQVSLTSIRPILESASPVWWRLTKGLSEGAWSGHPAHSHQQAPAWSPACSLNTHLLALSAYAAVPCLSNLIN